MTVSTFLTAVVLICSLIVPNEADTYHPFWKVFSQGTPIYRGRADPIVQPGVISGHSHKVFGASGFSFGGGRTPEELYDDLQNSTCTTVSLSVDKSNYWVPDLYYLWPNGSISLVPTGGITVYYQGRAGNGNQSEPNYQAFPRGFRMLAGDPFVRSYNGSTAQQAISWACLSTSPSPEVPNFPTATQFCNNGLRMQVYFPSCWNGIDIDTPSHKSHVSYPAIYNNGDCPAAFPVRLQSVFYEILFSVDQFPHGNGTQPFVLSCGDSTGYGAHGDFLNGWDVNIFQAALEDVTCYSNNTNNGNDVANCLTLAPYIKADNSDQSCVLDAPILNYEDIGINHLLSHLPGCNPISYGPASAIACSGSYAQVPQDQGLVSRVLIKSVRNNLFVSARSMYDYLTADTPQSLLSYPNVFELTLVAPGTYTIIPEVVYNFVSANNRADTPIIGDRPAWSTWETWNIEYINGTGPSEFGTLATILSYSDNDYVQVLSNGYLIANSSSVTGVNEEYIIIDANAGVLDTRSSSGTATATSSSASGTATATSSSATPTSGSVADPEADKSSAATMQVATLAIAVAAVLVSL